MSGAPVEARCGACGTATRVAASLRGGVVNCPRCGKLVEVSARSEWLYWSVVTGAVVLLLTFSAGAWLAFGWKAGLVVTALSAAAVLALFLWS